jgi:hypothetical protein
MESDGSSCSCPTYGFYTSSVDSSCNLCKLEHC